MNKLHAVVQRFRSGSADSDKIRFNLEVGDESRTRSFSTNEADLLKDTSTSIPGRKSDMEALKLAMSRQTQQLQNSILSTTADVATPPADKKMHKTPPAGTFEYSVEDGDTLVGIGARFDVTPSELIKVNRLLSRTVFVGQVLYIPDPTQADSSPPLLIKGPCPAPPVAAPHVESSKDAADVVSTAQPVSVVEDQVTDSQPHQEACPVEDPNKEEQQKCLQMPVRRVLEEEQRLTASEGFTIKGTLLVTPVSIMFDPDVCDPIVMGYKDPQKFSAAIYMEELRSAALFHDISPRMFWRQSKELRAHSPKPEPYRAGQGKRRTVEGHLEERHDTMSDLPLENTGTNRLEPGFDGDRGKLMESIDEVDTVDENESCADLGGTSLDREQLLSGTQERRLPENMDHTLSLSKENIPSSLSVTTSSSSELKHHEENPAVLMEPRDLESPRHRSSSEIHIPNSGFLDRIPDPSSRNNSRHSSFKDLTSAANESNNISTQGFEPLSFTDKSPNIVTAYPKPVPGQTVLVLSNSPITCTDVDEDIQAADTCPTKAENPELPLCTQTNIEDHLTENISDILCLETTNSTENTTISSSDAATLESQSSKVQDSCVTSHLSDEKPSLSLKKDVFGHNSSWSEKAQTVVDKLAFQVSNLTWESPPDQKDVSPKLSETSPRSTFSPLRTPVHHISSFFNYTTSFFQRPGSVDVDSSLATQSFSTEDKSSKHSDLPFATSTQLRLKSDFGKEDIARALGPDPRGFMMRSDSCYFKDAPLYLQIRRGIRKNVELLQPRAFDHWNTGPLVYEYWFVVPREMGDKLYNFLMTWQPDAYGDEEETEPRNRFFHDIRQIVDSPGLATSKVGNDFRFLEGSGNETEKSWEILSTEEVYRAEKELQVHRQDTIDESNLPELIGSTVIITQDHMIAILRSLPRNMSVGYNWELVYGTHRHGYSLQNMYMRTELVEFDLPVLLFITDTYGTVFGAFLSNTIRPSDTFYGSGATFLFTFYPEFKKFSWCGENQFFMHGTKEFFAVGSGEGLFGLWLDGSLDKGRSHPCTTFCNDVLAREEDFSILQLEVWKFVDSSLC